MTSIHRDFFDEEYRRLWSAVITEERTRRELSGLGALLEDCPPPASILDVGGGDGRIARPLGLAEYEVTVLDASSSMLSNGLQQPAAEHVSWLLGDGRRIPLADNSVDCVLNIFTSFGYFETDEEHQLMVGELARVLRPGGILVMDMMHRDWAVHAGPNRSWIETPDGGQVLREFSFDPVTGRSHETARLAGSEERVRQWSLRIFSATELDGMLRAAGLEPTAWYSDFELHPFDPAGPRMLVVARKPGGRDSDASQHVEIEMPEDVETTDGKTQKWRSIVSRLACPETGRPLTECTQEALDILNQAIADGQVDTVKGEAFTETLSAALIREDGLRVYPVQNGVPVLFVEEALAVDDLSLR